MGDAAPGGPMGIHTGCPYMGWGGGAGVPLGMRGGKYIIGAGEGLIMGEGYGP